MDILEDTWHVIDTYFKSTEYYIEKHHIDSYNDFIDVKLKQIFRQTYKQNVFRSGIPENHYFYTAHLYIGGKNGDKYYISKPTIYDHEEKKMKILYPNEARLKNITYGADVYIDIDVECSLFNENTGKYIYQNIQAPSTNFMKNKFLIRIPIMINSVCCLMVFLMVNQLGEGRLEQLVILLLMVEKKNLFPQKEKPRIKFSFIKQIVIN